MKMAKLCDKKFYQSVASCRCQTTTVNMIYHRSESVSSIALMPLSKSRWVMIT